MRELLRNAKSRNRLQPFELAVPRGIDEVMIAENRGEDTVITRLDVVVGGGGWSHVKHRRVSQEMRVESRHPYRVDLRPFLPRGTTLGLEGSGFYIMHTNVVCPLVFPLPGRWVQMVALADRRR
jgi:hypothetical protein